MTREPAQAGNRAGRTELHLQWWDDSPERLAVTSVADKQRNSSLFVLSLARAIPNENADFEEASGKLSICNAFEGASENVKHYNI